MRTSDDEVGENGEEEEGGNDERAADLVCDLGHGFGFALRERSRDRETNRSGLDPACGSS